MQKRSSIFLLNCKCITILWKSCGPGRQAIASAIFCLRDRGKFWENALCSQQVQFCIIMSSLLWLNPNKIKTSANSPSTRLGFQGIEIVHAPGLDSNVS